MTSQRRLDARYAKFRDMGRLGVHFTDSSLGADAE
jgi:hypothetical protein